MVSLIAVLLLLLKIDEQDQTIFRLQQKAVDEQIAVWYVSAEGKRGFKWISEIFEEQLAQK